MKKILIFNIIAVCMLSCKWQLPEEKKMANCQNVFSITAAADPTNLKKYTFTLNGSNIAYPIEWLVSGTKLGTSPGNSTSYTFAADQTYKITGIFKNSCGEQQSTETTVIVSSQLSTASSFALTDPMVSGQLQAVAVTNDGTVIVNDYNEIKVWNYKNKTLLRTLTGHSGIITDLALSKDDKYIFSSSNGSTIIVYDWKTGAEVRRLSGHTSNVYSLSISPDNKYLASCSFDKTIRIWNVSDGVLVRAITNDDYLYDVSVSNDGQYIVASNTKSLKLWNGKTGQELWRNDNSTIYDVAINADGSKIWVSGYKNNASYLEVWNANTKSIEKSFNTYATSLVISTDGQYILAGETLINIQTNAVIWSKSNLLPYVASGSNISNNSEYNIAGSSVGALSLSPFTTGTKIDNSLVNHQMAVSNGYISKDKNYLVTNDLKSVKFWNLSTGIEKPQNGITSQNGITNILLMNDAIWLKTCSLEKRNLNNIPITAASVSLNYCSQIISIGSDERKMAFQNGTNSIGIYDAGSGSLIKNIATNISSINYLAFFNNNKNLVFVDNGNTIKILDIEMGTLSRTISTNISQISRAVLSDDGLYIAVSDYQKIQIFDINTGNEINTISSSSNNYNARSLSFSLDKKNIAVGYYDRNVKVLSIATGTTLQERILNAIPVNLYFNANGTQLYVVTEKNFQTLNVQ